MENKLDGLQKLNRKPNKKFEAFILSILPYILSAKDMKEIMKNNLNQKLFLKKFKKNFHNPFLGDNKKVAVINTALKIQKMQTTQRRHSVERVRVDSLWD